MKKYVWLAVVTVLALTGVLLVGEAVRVEPLEVSVMTLEPQMAVKTVSCSGKIEAAESRKIYTEVSCVAQEVLVTAGQEVRKGDVLFTVDVDATRQVLATLGGVSEQDLPAGPVETAVTAPVSGIITSLNAAEGELTDASKPCVVIAPDSSLQVSVAIHERDIKNVRVGQKAVISGVAFAKDSYSGTVKSISSSARQQYVGSVSETVVDAVVELPDDEVDDSLRLGLTAKAQVVVSSAQDSLLVPYEYVLQDDQGREFVYVAENGRAVKRCIETGDELRSGFSVTAGLQAGERIITNPDAIPQNGVPITVRSDGGGKAS